MFVQQCLRQVRTRLRASFGLLFIALLLLSGTARAIDADVKLSELHHASWRSDDGAPANIVALAQTPDGFIWLGTGGGLFRFDGVRFELMNSLGGSALLNTSITALYVTPSGMLVIGYRFGGVSVFQEGRIRHYVPTGGMPNGNASAFTQSKDGDLWAAFTGGVGRLHDGAWTQVALDGEMQPNRTMVRDAEGNIWVTAKTGAYVLPNGSSVFQRVAADLKSFPFLSLAPDGRVWAVDFERLRIVPVVREGAAFRSAPSAEPIVLPPKSDLNWFESSGALWVRTGDGIARIPTPESRAKSNIELLGDGQGLAGDVFSFLEDREGNIWLGTAGGLHRFTQTNVRKVDLGVHASDVGVSRADGADVWVISALGGLHRIGASMESYPTIAVRGSHIHRDRDGVVWIGSRNALWKLDGPGPATLVSRPDVAVDDQSAAYAPIHAMAKDRSGALWVYIVGKGTFRKIGDHWNTLPGGPELRVMSMGNDAEGRLWIGYVDGYATRIDGDETQKFSPQNGLDIGAITAIFGHGPRVWLGGQRGLALYEGNAVRMLSLQGLGEMSGISGIVETASGQLWLNAANGLTKIEAAEWQKARADPAYAMRFERFDGNDGLLGSASQIRPLPSLIEAGDGRLWAALPSGLFVIDPAHLRRNRLAPSVVIRALYADGKRIEPGSKDGLPVGRADIRVDYTATSLVVPARVRFRYKLEGYDASWRDATGSRDANYTQVGPGNYVFRVIACNNDGVWNETGASLAFTVPPAIWQTRWFAVLVGMAACALLWALYRWRIRQVSRRLRESMNSRLQERERIARELHDTLIQSVTGLTLHVRAAANQSPKGSALRSRLDVALARATELIVEARDRITELRSHQKPGVSLATVLERVCRELSEAFPGPSVQLELKGSSRAISAPVAEEIELIVREALTNALQHSGARSISVSLRFDHDALRVHLLDDGRGFEGLDNPETSRPGHFGLAGMRERAGQIEGQLRVRSDSQGTTVELTVPAVVAYASVPHAPGGSTNSVPHKRETEP